MSEYVKSGNDNEYLIKIPEILQNSNEENLIEIPTFLSGLYDIAPLANCTSIRECGVCESMCQNCLGTGCVSGQGGCGACEGNNCESVCQNCMGSTCQVCQDCQTSCEKSGQTPTVTPASFSITTITANSVTIRVTVGDSTYFRIYCRTGTLNGSGTEVWSEYVTRTSNFSYTITGLSPNTTYTVNVHYDNGNAWVGGKEFTTLALVRPNNWYWSFNVNTHKMPVVGKEIHVLDASEWNNFCDRIDEFRVYKGLPTYGGSSTNNGFARRGRVNPGQELTADIVNDAIYAIYGSGQMGNGSIIKTVSSEDIITGDLFTQLANKLNNTP